MNPTMNNWTSAWRNADAEVFKNLYSENALIFPPNKPTIQGNENILDFMKGGLGKVDVIFQPKEQIINDEMAFEYGDFSDQEINSNKILGTGKYSVTWILEDEVWKILCHTWEMPSKT